MKIINQKLSKEEFKKYVEAYDFGSIRPSKLVIHHTVSPTKESWNGKKTMEGMKNYYEGLGWPSGPHIFVAEDGVWLFTPMYEVGTHARGGNGSWITRSLPKWYSLGIEVVGNYDLGVWQGKTKDNALGVISTLKNVLELENEDITMHRDWNSTHCPGLSITKEWLLKELQLYGTHGQPAPSPWAEDGWNWQQELGLDLSVHPQQKVDAEWVFAILKKLNDIQK